MTDSVSSSIERQNSSVNFSPLTTEI